jgi:hypothetical protein
VAVEKVGFPEKSQISGDRKCLGDSEKSFAEFPDAIQFLQILGERVFQQPPCSRHLSGNAPVSGNTVYQTPGKFVVPTVGEGYDSQAIGLNPEILVENEHRP